MMIFYRKRGSERVFVVVFARFLPEKKEIELYLAMLIAVESLITHPIVL
jgi:hypothetical protein